MKNKQFHHHLPLLPNAIFNSLGFLVLGGIFFWLTPIILHRLGDEGFGVWTIATSVMAYSTIIGLGLPGAIIRYFSLYYAQHNTRQLNEVINSALVLLIPLSLLVIILSILFSSLFPRFMDINPFFYQQATLSFILIGTDFAFALVRSGIKNIIFAIERVFIYNLIDIIIALIRATLIYLLVWNQNLVMLCFLSLICGGLELIISIFVIRRLCPLLRLGFHHVKKNKIKQLLSYGIMIVLMNCGYLLVFFTDAIVIGVILSVVSVTVYSIAARLIEFGCRSLESLTQVIIPRSSSLRSQNENMALRQICLSGTKFCFAFALFFIIGLIGFGRSFITLWVGESYSEGGWIVLVILGTGHLFVMTSYAGCAILLGTGNHKHLAVIAISQGIVNLALSLTFVHIWGIFGVALGTTIPHIFASGIVMTYLFKKEFDLELRTLLKYSILPVAIAGISLILTLYLCSLWIKPTSMFNIAASISLGIAIYGIFFWHFSLNVYERKNILRSFQFSV